MDQPKRVGCGNAGCPCGASCGCGPGCTCAQRKQQQTMMNQPQPGMPRQMNNGQGQQDQKIVPEMLKVLEDIWQKEPYGKDLKARLTVDEMRPGCMACTLDITDDFQNLYGTLHGGAYIYLADMASSMSIIAADPEHRFSVSIELENTFLKPAPVGTKICITSNVLRIGKSVATADVRFTDKNSGELLGYAKQTKFFLKSKA